MKKLIQTCIFALMLFSVSTGLFSETITFSADKMQGNTSESDKYTKLIGRAHIKTESLEISADEITLSGEDFRFISAKGSVNGKNSEAGFDFNCGSMSYDRETKIALLEHNVRMIDKANDVNASAQIIEYTQETENAVMQVNVSIKQKENVCSGAVAIYRKAEQVLELSGNARIERGKDLFRAQEIQLNIKTEAITMDGKVRGSAASNSESKAGGQ